MFPLELSIGARGQKTRIMVLPGQEKSLPISLAVWIQYTNVTEGLADRHWATAKTTLAHSIARVKIADSCATYCEWYGMVWYGMVEFNVPLDTV